MVRYENATITGTGLKVVLEIFFMTLPAPDSLRYVVRRLEISTRGIDPDDGVLQLIAETGNEGIAVKREHCFIHSTSWRYEPERTIVLTYLVYSDYMAFRDEAGTVFKLVDVPLATSADPGRPRPREIGQEQVAAHAMRHLSFLVKNGPGSVHGILSTETQNFLMAINDLPAGKLGENMPAASGTTLPAVQALHTAQVMNRISDPVRIQGRS